MKRFSVLVLILLIFGLQAAGQVYIQRAGENRFLGTMSVGKGSDLLSPHSSAVLDLGVVGGNKGILFPRTLNSNIIGPTESLFMWDTQEKRFEYWSEELLAWVSMIDQRQLTNIFNGNNAFQKPLWVNNGLNLTGDTLLQLGGPLIQNTSIGLDVYNLNFTSNTGYPTVSATNTANSGTLLNLRQALLPWLTTGYFRSGSNQGGDGYYIGANLGMTSSGVYIPSSTGTQGVGLFLNTTNGKPYFRVAGSDANGVVNENLLTVSKLQNVLINTEIDVGYKLDVNGSFRATGDVRLDKMPTRNDSATVRVLYVNESGDLRYGRISATAFGVMNGLSVDHDSGTMILGGPLTYDTQISGESQYSLDLVKMHRFLLEGDTIILTKLQPQLSKEGLEVVTRNTTTGVVYRTPADSFGRLYTAGFGLNLNGDEFSFNPAVIPNLWNTYNTNDTITEPRSVYNSGYGINFYGSTRMLQGSTRIGDNEFHVNAYSDTGETQFSVHPNYLALYNRTFYNNFAGNRSTALNFRTAGGATGVYFSYAYTAGLGAKFEMNDSVSKWSIGNSNASTANAQSMKMIGGNPRWIVTPSLLPAASGGEIGVVWDPVTYQMRKGASFDSTKFIWNNYGTAQSANGHISGIFKAEGGGYFGPGTAFGHALVAEGSAQVTGTAYVGGVHFSGINSRFINIGGPLLLSDGDYRFGGDYEGNNRNAVTIYRSGKVRINGTGIEPLAEPTSNLDVNGTGRFSGTLTLGNATSDPVTTTGDGGMYYNESTDKFKGLRNGAWQNFAMEADVANLLQTGRVVTVDAANANSTDSRSGISVYSTATPFKTIQAAFLACASGDIIHIKNSTYYENVYYAIYRPDLAVVYPGRPSVVIIENATIDGGLGSAFFGDGNTDVTIFLKNGVIKNKGRGTDPSGTAAVRASTMRISIYGTTPNLDRVESDSAMAFNGWSNESYTVKNVSLRSNQYFAYGSPYGYGSESTRPTFEDCSITSRDSSALSGYGLRLLRCYVKGDDHGYYLGGYTSQNVYAKFDIVDSYVEGTKGHAIGGAVWTDSTPSAASVQNSTLVSAGAAIQFGSGNSSFNHSLTLENVKINITNPATGYALELPVSGDTSLNQELNPQMRYINTITNRPLHSEAFLNSTSGYMPGWVMGQLVKEINTSTADTSAFYGVKTGFGTHSPTANVHVKGTARFDISDGTLNTNDKVLVKDTATGLTKLVPSSSFGGGSSVSVATNEIAYGTGGSITSNSNLQWISNSNKLQVWSPDLTAGAINRIDLYGGIYGIGLSGGAINYISNGTHVFYNNASGSSVEKAKLNDAGEFLVNTTDNGDYKLQVQGDVAINGSFNTLTKPFEVYTKSGNPNDLQFAVKDNFTGGEIFGVTTAKALKGLNSINFGSSALNQTDAFVYTNTSNSAKWALPVDMTAALTTAAHISLGQNGSADGGFSAGGLGIGTTGAADGTTGASGKGAWLQAMHFNGTYAPGILWLNPLGGNINIKALAGNGDGVVKVDNTGTLSWMATPTGGSDTNFGNTDITATGNRVHNFGSNKLVINKETGNFFDMTTRASGDLGTTFYIQSQGTNYYTNIWQNSDWFEIFGSHKTNTNWYNQHRRVFQSTSNWVADRAVRGNMTTAYSLSSADNRTNSKATFGRYDYWSWVDLPKANLKTLGEFRADSLGVGLFVNDSVDVNNDEPTIGVLIRNWNAWVEISSLKTTKTAPTQAGTIKYVTTDSSGRLSFANAISGSVAVIGDAAYTVASGITDVTWHTTLTANRNLTLPDPTTSAGRRLKIANPQSGAYSIVFNYSVYNNSAYSWTDLGSGNWVEIISNGTNWIVVAQGTIYTAAP